MFFSLNTLTPILGPHYVFIIQTRAETSTVKPAGLTVYDQAHCLPTVTRGQMHLDRFLDEIYVHLVR